ncbi:MAG: hypothetical protein IKA06_02320 [Clostridia bacterium]|nr:hypothetical protein [Clostridia bacterium]
MKEKTTLADRYLFENFYQTCTDKSKKAINCRGIELCDDYSWIDVVLDGEKTCRECEFRAERQGFYYGKNEFSTDFEKREFITLRKIRKQEEFEAVCQRISSSVRGIVIQGAVSDASPLERFSALEFVAFQGQRIACFWNTAKTPKLRMLTIWINKNLKSLSGLEAATNLECLQIYTPFSDVAVHKIESFSPISNLVNLKEVIISATEPLDQNIDYLIDLPILEHLWISPNLFPTENYAKFEAKRFKLSEEYGIYCEESDDIYPYGKGKRVMHTAEKKNRYLEEYNKFFQKYKKL